MLLGAVTASFKLLNYIIMAKKQCYYHEDGDCEGNVVEVSSFKNYLCEKCLKEEESIIEEEVNVCGNVMDYLSEWNA